MWISLTFYSTNEEAFLTIISLKYQEKIYRRLICYKKRLLFANRRPYHNTLSIFIMGCGRSGTSMMVNIFQRDDRIEALAENDPKVAQNFMLVYEKIAPAIEYCKAPVLIMKPILNSFDASRLLEMHDRGKIIWMLRDYKDMVASSIEKFGPVVSGYIKNLVLFKNGNSWLSSGIPSETLNMLSNIDSTAFTDYDWMGLVWWTVNRTIMLDRLYQSGRFLLLEYENIVRHPDAVLTQVYNYIGLQYKDRAGKYVSAASVGKGADIPIHPYVRELCENLAHDLTQIHKN